MSTPNELMRHALGVQEQGYGRRWSKPYRNHFVACEMYADAWRELERAGLAKCTRNGSDMTGGFPVFVVTEAGRAVALAGLTFKRVWGYGTDCGRFHRA